MEITKPFAIEPIDLAVSTWGRCSGEMVIALELRFEGRLDVRLLALATQLLLDAEPILACRFATDGTQPRWEPVPRADRRAPILTQNGEEYERIRRGGLDARANVQVALCVWRREDGDQILVQMTHEVGDGVAIQALAARLALIYSKLCVDIGYRPCANLGGRRDLGQLLSRVPKRAFPRILWDFVTFTAPRCFPRRTQSLFLPSESIGPWVPVIRRLPSPSLSILSAYAKSRGATINDMFLAAAYRALASQRRADSASGLRIATTVDLRRWCLPHSDTISICNLSSFEYPYLVRRFGRDFDETLAKVSAMTRRRKRSWPGLVSALLGHIFMKLAVHRTLRHVADHEKRNVKGANPLTLSNEGALNKTSLRFGAQVPVSAYILPPFLFLPSVHICLSSYAGSLTLAAVTPQNGEAIVARYLDVLLSQLPMAVDSGFQPSVDKSARRHTPHLTAAYD